MLGKPKAHSERTFAHKSAHLRKRAHISKVPTSTFLCHNSARAENCKTYTFHDHEHKFKRAEKSVLLKIQDVSFHHGDVECQKNISKRFMIKLDPHTKIQGNSLVERMYHPKSLKHPTFFIAWDLRARGFWVPKNYLWKLRASLPWSPTARCWVYAGGDNLGNIQTKKQTNCTGPYIISLEIQSCPQLMIGVSNVHFSHDGSKKWMYLTHLANGTWN